MKKNIWTALCFTIVTTVIFGVVYPFAVTGLAQLLFPAKANGQLISKGGTVVGSRIIGQAFTGPGYFHSRPSVAGTGNGYDPTASSGSNLGPTNKMLSDRVTSAAHTMQAENPSVPVPVDMVTTSASGLDPDITPAAAEFQIPRVAREREIGETALRQLIAKHTDGRQFGFLGETSVNVLELNLDLDATHPAPAHQPAPGTNISSTPSGDVSLTEASH